MTPKLWILAGAALFLMVAATLFTPDAAVMMLNELLGALGGLS